MSNFRHLLRSLNRVAQGEEAIVMFGGILGGNALLGVCLTLVLCLETCNDECGCPYS
jgi:hypothetical protein